MIKISEFSKKLEKWKIFRFIGKFSSTANIPTHQILEEKFRFFQIGKFSGGCGWGWGWGGGGGWGGCGGLDFSWDGDEDGGGGVGWGGGGGWSGGEAGGQVQVEM